MTTTAAGRLTDTLQSLVDARLDTIDRMLIGRVNRHDRLAIVRDVETQIFDLIEGRNAENLDRDDVLAVLARLDPPEAYLPDEATGELRPSGFAMPSRAIRPAQVEPGKTGLVSGILGIVGVVVFVFDILIAFAGGFNGPGGEVPLFGLLGLSFILGLLAVILAARARLRNAWAITGLVTGIISMLASIFVVLTG